MSIIVEGAVYVCSVIIESVMAVLKKSVLFVTTFDNVITLLFFLNLLYLFFPVFGTPTAPRAFELFTRFKRSRFSTDLRQCSCFSDTVSIFLSLFITLFILSIFLLT